MDRIDHWLREASRGMSPDAVLAQPVYQLQGVSDEAMASLADIGIHSILDLAASAQFAVARHVVEAADGEGPLALLPLPSDLIDDTLRGLTAAEIARRDISVLRTLEPMHASRLQLALPAPSVRDLALWPPATHARRILQIAYGGLDPAEDPEAPSELRPRMGRLPVERVQHEQLYFEGLLDDLGQGPDIARGAPDYLGPLKGTEWPLDLNMALMGQGFDRPGLGLQVTVAQSWTPVGLALGHLLHSLALAPGEATRLAVIEWTRRVAGGTAEDIAENEALSNSLARQRSVSEVVDVVAKEMQKGKSSFSMTGAGWGIGGAAAGGADGGDKKGAASLGFGYSRNDAEGSTMSSSQGQRDVGSKLSQHVQDRSEQAASLARGRRASVVTEVSVSEAEQLSTRVVANYNHMHALSVLYFEVVQIYRLRTEVEQIEPLLYLPVRPLSFDNPALVERYRGLLAEVALNVEARNALLGIPPASIEKIEAETGTTRLILTGLRGAQMPVQGNTSLDNAGLISALGQHAIWSSPTELRLHNKEAALVEVQVSGWYINNQQPMGPALNTLNRIGVQGVEPYGFKTWARPRDKRYFALGSGESDTPYSVTFENEAIRLETLRSLDVGVASGMGKVDLEAVLVFKRLDPRGRPVGEPVTLRAGLSLDGQAAEVPLLKAVFKPDTIQETPKLPAFDLAAHLQANALHYTMALLRRADPALLGLFFGQIQHGGQALLSQIDPHPVAHVGNYLVFRWPAVREAPWWKRLLEARGLPGASRRESLVPMPTGGVFAEAVQGRFNSAEKLDLSRFWNWQDSPIPLTPTEIAPLQAGQHQTAQTPTINPLGNAQLQQMQPLVMPDYSAAVAKVAEIAGKGDSFRDMSGMNSLLQQGGAAMSLAAQGAREFMAKAMETVSAYGARINEGKKIDDDKAAAAKKAAPAGNGTGNTPAGSGTGATGGGTGTPGSGQGGGTSGSGQPSTPGNKSNNTTPATPSKREEAFDGPQPAAVAETPQDASAPGWLTLRVTVLPRDLTKTAQVLDLSGRLEMIGPYAVEIPTGFWNIDLFGGIGELSARITKSSRVALRGNLIVTTFGGAQWDLLPGLQVPGLPSGWLEDRVSDFETKDNLNIVPVNSIMLPGGNGNIEVELQLRLALFSLLSVRKTIESAGGTFDFNNALSISMASRFAGATATPAELDALTQEIHDKLNAVRYRFIHALRNSQDSSFVWPIVAASIDYSPTTRNLNITPRWALITDPVLALKDTA
jgi:hypothetical protein